MNITTESEMIDASKVRYLRSKTIIIVICTLIHDLFIIGKGYCIIIINAITDEIYLHHYCNFAGTKHIELHNEGINLTRYKFTSLVLNVQYQHQ